MLPQSVMRAAQVFVDAADTWVQCYVGKLTPVGELCRFVGQHGRVLSSRLLQNAPRRHRHTSNLAAARESAAQHTRTQQTTRRMQHAGGTVQHNTSR